MLNLVTCTGLARVAVPSHHGYRNRLAFGRRVRSAVRQSMASGECGKKKNKKTDTQPHAPGEVKNDSHLAGGVYRCDSPIRRAWIRHGGQARSAMQLASKLSANGERRRLVLSRS